MGRTWYENSGVTGHGGTYVTEFTAFGATYRMHTAEWVEPWKVGKTIAVYRMKKQSWNKKYHPDRYTWVVRRKVYDSALGDKQDLTEWNRIMRSKKWDI